MEDKEIIELYYSRSETAISETDKKYGKYCNRIAYNVLGNVEDSEECVNDTYMSAWNTIPPQHPKCLLAFLGKITRNISINRYKKCNAKKRGAGQVELVLEELQECIRGKNSVEEMFEKKAIVELLNGFLEQLPLETRRIFMKRYWYMYSIKDISKDFGISESKVKMSLHRARKQLKQLLEKEGVYL